jgi:glycosyltransferase involved in cell wall biosynthesis
MKPLVTVLMPAYNAAAYIGFAIDSVLKQTYENFELIIVNDCSTDDTAKIIAGYSDPRIRVITNEKNLTLSPTLNKGLEQARGEFIARLDADDIAYPTRLAQQVACFERDRSLGLVSSWNAIIDAKNRVTAIARWRFTPESLYFALQFRNCLTHSSVMFNKKLVKALGGYTVGRSEDYDLWSKLVATVKFHHIYQPLVQWRDIPTSLSHVQFDKSENDAYRYSQNRLKEKTGKEYPLPVVAAMARGDLVNTLSASERQLLAEAYPGVVQAILDTAPRYCDKDALVEYAYIELVRYAFLLSWHGVAMDLSDFSITHAHWLKGYLLYGARHRRNRIFSIVVPKLHL